MTQTALLTVPAPAAPAILPTDWTTPVVDVPRPRVSAFQSVPPISKREMRPAMEVQSVLSIRTVLTGLTRSR